MFRDVPENELQDETSVAVESETEETAAPEKSRSWIGLAGIGVIVVGVAAFLHFRNGPAAAAADEVAQQTVSTFLSTGKKSMSTLKEMLDKTARTVDQMNAPAAEPAKLAKNPFFKPEPAAAPITAAPAVDEARGQALQRASQLKLQSILVSGSRAGCMIDNRYREVGDAVGTFTVERIAAGGVIVRDGAFRFELKVSR